MSEGFGNMGGFGSGMPSGFADFGGNDDIFKKFSSMGGGGGFPGFG